MATRILVVNDTQEILDLFVELLSEEAYEVVTYSYAIQEMDEIERIKPDLIIVDCMFGAERPGWQMLQKLKMRRATARIPVVICTHTVEVVRDLEGYLKAKGVSVVLKPFDIDDLLLAVRLALQSYQQTAQQTEGKDQNGEVHGR